MSRQSWCGAVSRRSALLGLAGTSAVGIAGGFSKADALPGRTSDSFEPYKGDWQYSVRHYRIGDTVLTGASGTHARVSGLTTMECTANVSTKAISFDLALVPRSVKVNGVTKPFARAKNPNPHQWTVSELSLRKGDIFTIDVRYNDIPWQRRSPYEISKSRGVVENGTVTTFSGEPEVAVYWYASNDRIDNKATYDISISTQRGNAIIAYGAPAAVPFGSGAMVNTRINIPEPVSSYHPGLTVGPGIATERGTITVGGTSVPYLYSGLGTVAANLRTHTRGALDYFSGLVAPYPFSRAGGLTLTTFAVGGQEQVGLVNYRRSLVDKSPSFIAHENAHMWFGNSVTAKDWRDVLLIHEGLATLLQNDYARHATIKGAYTPVKSAAAGSLGPAYLADDGAYNKVYGAQRALRYAMDRTFIAENAPNHRAFLKDLATKYRHGVVTRSQFKQLAQTHSPNSLDQVWADYGMTG